MSAKEEAIRKVLEKRMKVIEDHILISTGNQTPLNKAYYQGKRDAYMQAYDLIGETLESIRAELCLV